MRAVMVRVQDGVEAGDLRTLATTLRDKLSSGEGLVIVASRSTDGTKVPFVAGATKEAVAHGVHSGNLIKLIGSYIDGRGGGKPDMAQGSGTNADALDAAFNAVRSELENL